MARPSPYAAHRRFAAPAQGTPGARAVILGFIIVESLYRMGQQLMGYALDRLDPVFAQDVLEGSTAPGLLVNLGSFALLILALGFVLSRVHGRRLISLLGPRAALWPQFRVSFLAVAALFTGFELLANGVDYSVAIMRPLPEWLLLLLPGFAALAIQTGSEELLYRGYLQQQIAVLLPHPAAWLILPNLVFAFAHWSPYAGLESNLPYLIWAFFFGLAASDLTGRAGTLAPAFALHLANNAYAFLFFGEGGGPDSGLALLLFPPPPAPGADAAPLSPLADLVPELVVLLLAWGAIRLALRR